MILIIGGRGAGKREFATTLGCDPEKTLPALHALEPLPSLKDLLNYEVVICDEVGCGVVPMERHDRERREDRKSVGRPSDGCAVSWPKRPRRYTVSSAVWPCV